MSDCIFCGEKAGLFKSEHENCVENAKAGIDLIEKKVEAELSEVMDTKVFFSELEAIGRSHRCLDVKSAIGSAIDRIIATTSREHTFDNLEYGRAVALYGEMGYATVVDAAKIGFLGYIYAAFSNILFNVKNKNHSDDDIRNFILRRSEKPIHRFGSVTFAEERTVRTSGYGGVSVPLGGGIRLNTGSFGSTSQTGLTMVDAGDLLFTDQNLYFGGQHSSFTISFTSILRLEQYIDGIGIFPSHGTQKVFIPVMQFGIEIGWFVTHLAKFLLEQAQQD